MKHIQRFLVALLLLLSVLTATPAQANIKTKEDGVLNIGVFQFVAHPALDDMAEGIEEVMSEYAKKQGLDLEIDFQNGQGDMGLVSSIAKEMVNKDPDILFAIATPPVQALQQETDEIPIIMTGVTDPVRNELIDDEEKPGANVTGALEETPPENQIHLIQKVLPEAKTIGMIYSSSEVNSKPQVERARAEAEKQGFKVIEETISSTVDMQLVAQELSSKVDAIYLPTDNIIASSLDTLLDATDKNKIPVFPTAETMVEQGGLAADALSQYEIGVLAAEMAIDILEGADPATYPARGTDDTKLVYNSETMEYLGIELPKEILEEATDLSKE